MFQKQTLGGRIVSFVFVWMVVDLQILASKLKVHAAIRILSEVSLYKLLSAEIKLPRYLKSFTSSVLSTVRPTWNPYCYVALILCGIHFIRLVLVCCILMHHIPVALATLSTFSCMPFFVCERRRTSYAKSASSSRVVIHHTSDIDRSMFAFFTHCQ